MSRLHWLDEAARDDFAAAGLASLEALAACRTGEEVTRAATRVCRRLRLGAGVYYLKAQTIAPGALPLRRWPSYLGRGSPLAREARSLRRLAGLGVAVPELVCHGSDTYWWGMPRRAVLATRELEGFVDLAALARAEPGRARDAAAHLEALVARLHAAGLCLGGVKYRNVLVGPQSELALIDLPDLRPARFGRGRDRALLAAERGRHLDRG